MAEVGTTILSRANDRRPRAVAAAQHGVGIFTYVAFALAFCFACALVLGIIP